MSHSSVVRIGMLKAVPAKWDVPGNWAVFEAQFQAHGRDVDVFVTPECFLDGYAVTEKEWRAQRFADVAHPSRQPDFYPAGED